MHEDIWLLYVKQLYTWLYLSSYPVVNCCSVICNHITISTVTILWLYGQHSTTADPHSRLFISVCDYVQLKINIAGRHMTILLDSAGHVTIRDCVSVVHTTVHIQPSIIVYDCCIYDYWLWTTARDFLSGAVNDHLADCTQVEHVLFRWRWYVVHLGVWYVVHLGVWYVVHLGVCTLYYCRLEHSYRLQCVSVNSSTSIVQSSQIVVTLYVIATWCRLQTNAK